MRQFDLFNLLSFVSTDFNSPLPLPLCKVSRAQPYLRGDFYNGFPCEKGEEVVLSKRSIGHWLLASGAAPGGIMEEADNGAAFATTQAALTTTISRMQQQSKAPVPKVRSDFPETWLWSNAKSGYNPPLVHSSSCDSVICFLYRTTCISLCVCLGQAFSRLQQCSQRLVTLFNALSQSCSSALVYPEHLVAVLQC